MSEAKKLTAKEEAELRTDAADENGAPWYRYTTVQDLLATLDAERAKVEALESNVKQATAHAATGWERARLLRAELDAAEARATAAEAEAERMREASAKAPGLRAGGWWYPEDQTDEGHCHFSPEEVVSDFYEPEPGDHVFALDRALSLPTVYAAVRVFTEAEKDARQDDEPFVMTLHATPDEACAALAKEKPDAGE